MSIAALHIGNFKGIADSVRVPLKPLSIFIGANSSGKSTCLHALAALSQSVKLPNSARPISLDDEFAYVHLGRFIEVIHSKSYQDAITLGIELRDATYLVETEKKFKVQRGPATAVYNFRCSKRTQELRVSEARFAIGPLSYTLKHTPAGYEVRASGSGAKSSVALRTAFLLTEKLPASRRDWAEYQQIAPLLHLQGAIQAELQQVLYLGPFRQPPLRRYPTRGTSPTEVGPQGEATTTLLANEIVQTRKRAHIAQISRWLKTLGIARAVDVARVAQSDLFDVSMTLDDGQSFPIADLGFGLSQVLPVLAQCAFAPSGATLLFEQPELHLHSLAVRPLARVFLETARRGVTVLVETHSPELIKQIQVDLRTGDVTLDEFALYRVSREAKKTVVAPIEIDPDGDIYESWEHGLSVP